MKIWQYQKQSPTKVSSSGATLHQSMWRIATTSVRTPDTSGRGLVICIKKSGRTQTDQSQTASRYITRTVIHLITICPISNVLLLQITGAYRPLCGMMRLAIRNALTLTGYDHSLVNGINRRMGASGILSTARGLGKPGNLNLTFANTAETSSSLLLQVIVTVLSSVPACVAKEKDQHHGGDLERSSVRCAAKHLWGKPGNRTARASAVLARGGIDKNRNSYELAGTNKPRAGTWGRR